MATYRRTLRRRDGLGSARYLTCSCRHRLPLFANDRIKSAFVDHLVHVQADMEFRLYAWVIMPEHFHLLLKPGTTTQPISQILRRLKAPFARVVIARWRSLNAPILNRIEGEDGTIRFWQPGGGYDRNEYSDSEMLEKINYIHANPVRRGLATEASEYRWSSVLHYVHRSAYQGPGITPLA